MGHEVQKITGYLCLIGNDGMPFGYGHAISHKGSQRNLMQVAMRKSLLKVIVSFLQSPTFKV